MRFIIRTESTRVPPVDSQLPDITRHRHVRPHAQAHYRAAVSDETCDQDDRALVIRDLTKRFGSSIAVAGVNLDVPRGCFFGLVGPNGAGKTTTMNMATGLLRPDTGSVWVDGLNLCNDSVAAKARIGVLPDGLRLFERLSAAELLTYHGLLRNIPEATVEERASQLLSTLDLANAGRKLVADFSHGMRKKITLAAALIHNPRLLFLDEPFEGVDPLSARTIRMVLDRFTTHGGTVVLSSHAMDLVERLCQHVAVMHQGSIVAAGPIDQVRQGQSLEDAFVALVGSSSETTDLSWLGTSLD